MHAGSGWPKAARRGPDKHSGARGIWPAATAGADPARRGRQPAYLRLRRPDPRIPQLDLRSAAARSGGRRWWCWLAVALPSGILRQQWRAGDPRWGACTEGIEAWWRWLHGVGGDLLGDLSAISDAAWRSRSSQRPAALAVPCGS